MERDYRPIPQLDVYAESSMLDETGSFGDLSPGARVSAEAEMRRRDRLMGTRQRGMPRGLLYDTEDEDEDVAVGERSRRRKSDRSVTCDYFVRFVLLIPYYFMSSKLALLSSTKLK